ncbi:MAG: DUF6973 domain-containing protein [Chloroflexota bacterium]
MEERYLVGTTLTSMKAYYMGGLYEIADGAVKKYYSIAGQTVALRDDSGLQYLLTDHLGSVVAVTNSNGTLTSQQRYLPFGEVRTIPNSPITITDFGFTGQRLLDSGMGGIMDYRARFYSPYLNRFTQPDTIIPNPSNPQSWNRYSYVVNRPTGLTDPSGHRCVGDPGECLDEDGDQSGGFPSSGSGANTSDRKDLHKELEEFDEPDRVSEEEMQLWWGAMLSPEEIRVLNSINDPLLALKMWMMQQDALNAAEAQFPNDLDGIWNDPGDAFRHAYWSALITREYGAEFASEFTTAHETEYSDQWDAREQAFMDLHNNEVGIRIAITVPNLSNQQLQDKIIEALRAGELYVWDRNDIYYSDMCPECIYP